MTSQTNPEAAALGVLTFRPFGQLPHRELMAELDYWESMERNATPGSAIQKIAERHANRCVETARSRIASLAQATSPPPANP